MAKEELGKLSPSQLKKLGNVISEAKGLTNQQAEIVERVLAGEEDIGKLRISYLEEYFDTYSKKLDQIARKHSSLDDAFLVLENKLNKNYKTLSDNISELIKQLERIPKIGDDGDDREEGGKSSKKTEKSSGGATSGLSGLAKNINGVLQALKSGANLNKDQYQTLLTKAADILTNAYNSITSAPAPSQDSTGATPASATTQEGAEDASNAVDIPNGFKEALKGMLDLISTMYDRSSSAPTTAGYESNRASGQTAATREQLTTSSGGSAAQPPTAPPAAPQEPPTAVPQTAQPELTPISYTEDEGGQEPDLQGLEYTRQDAINFLDEIAKNGIAAYTQEASVKARLQARNEELLKEWAKKEASIRGSMLDLTIAKLQTQEELENRSTEVRLTRLKEATEAELATQQYINKSASEMAFASTEEGAEIGARKTSAEAELKSAQELEANRIKWVERQELAAKRRNNGVLSKEEAARIQQDAAKKFKFDKENLDKLTKERDKLETAKERANERADMRSNIQNMLTAGTFEERKDAFKKLTQDENGDFDKDKAISAAITLIADLAKQLESKIDSIAAYKGDIDTRLQGSNNKRYAFSYWDQLTRDMMSVGAVTPFFKQEDFANNIKELVGKGIAFDLKQRAFLMTIQEKIANTFDVADGTLLRLIRIQQEDSTAGRLGMESALNSFLNNMYETSEYLTDVAASVRGSLEEMESLMKGAEATEVEFQVQKWMGSLYSVGMSQNAVTTIANALGQIASGQVDALTGNGAGNLLVMAANEAGLSIAEILAEGLDAKNTNKLLQATVNYLAEIAESSEGNNVVQQQLANVFGVKASDLRAATNLMTKDSVNDIFGEYKTYGNMVSQLHKMALTMGMRTSVGEAMTNIWENGQYSIASSIAKSPIAYLTYKLAGLLDSAVGGIDLPYINVMGNGVDLNTTVSDLMRVASVGAGLLGSLGPMINGLASSFSGNMMLATMGITSGSGLKVTPRGSTGGGLSDALTGGGAETTSGSGYVGNSSGSDVKDSTLQEAENSKKQQMVEAKEEEPANQVDVLNGYVVKIYELLENVTSGSKTFRVRVDDYGLTGTTSYGGSAQGGTAGLLGTSSDSNSLGGGSAGSMGSTSSGGGNSSVSGGFSSRSPIDLGGWTMM